MKKEVLISLEANEKRVAILEDGKLEEFFIERADTNRMFGNIYKGKVKSIVPGIQAAFVDLGTKKDGFLYVADAVESPLDIDSAFDEVDFRQRRDRSRIPRIENVLKEGQEITVQVVKEPIREGEKIRVSGGDRSFAQVVKSMQINHENILSAKRGDDVGMKMKKAVRAEDRVYRTD